MTLLSSGAERIRSFLHHTTPVPPFSERGPHGTRAAGTSWPYEGRELREDERVTLFGPDRFGTLPKSVDVTERRGDQLAGFGQFESGNHRVIGVSRAGVRTVNRLPMGGELEVAQLIAELVALRFEEELNPSDVMLCRVRVSHLPVQ
jgi:hypothetical protein